MASGQKELETRIHQPFLFHTLSPVGTYAARKRLLVPRGKRYPLISKLELFLSFFVELLEFSEDRHPWESVEEKLDAIRYELLASIILPFIVLSSSLPLSFRPCISPFLPRSPFSLPFQLLFPTLHPCRLSLGRYFTTLPSSFSLPMPFSRLCLPSSPCPFLSHRP